MKRVALITGAAGGIGNAALRVFAEADWHVIGVDRRGDCALPTTAEFIQADISQPDTLENLLEQTAAWGRGLDALINNAAVQICKPLLDTTIEEWDTVMRENVRSAFLLCKHAHPLLKRCGGAIVNVCSVHAVATSANIAAYAASKGAMLSLTRATALEFGRDGIRVNAVLPGAVDTPMLHAGLMRGHAGAGAVEDLVVQLGWKHVMGKVGRPEEIGEAILFLADGKRSSFMTGQALVVDGGATARLSTE